MIRGCRWAASVKYAEKPKLPVDGSLSPCPLTKLFDYFLNREEKFEIIGGQTGLCGEKFVLVSISVCIYPFNKETADMICLFVELACYQ